MVFFWGTSTTSIFCRLLGSKLTVNNQSYSPWCTTLWWYHSIHVWLFISSLTRPYSDSSITTIKDTKVSYLPIILDRIVHLAHRTIIWESHLGTVLKQSYIALLLNCLRRITMQCLLILQQQITLTLDKWNMQIMLYILDKRSINIKTWINNGLELPLGV